MNDNIDYVKELEKVANCMDETTVYDREQILSDLNEQKDKLVSCYRMWLVSVGMVILEVAVFILGFILSKCKRAQQYRRNYEVNESFRDNGPPVPSSHGGIDDMPPSRPY